MLATTKVRNQFALIVIDMLVDFFDRVPTLAAQREQLVSGINQLVGHFRKAGQPIIWVRQEFAADLSDAFLDMRRRNVSVTIAGTDGCQILPELDRRDDDAVIVKKRYSAFYGTALDEVLAAIAPDTLVLAGINTHACIRSTAIDAYQRDFDIVIARDCVGSHDREHHHVTLRYFDDHIASIWSNEELTLRIGAS